MTVINGSSHGKICVLEMVGIGLASAVTRECRWIYISNFKIGIPQISMLSALYFDTVDHWYLTTNRVLITLHLTKYDCTRSVCFAGLKLPTIYDTSHGRCLWSMEAAISWWILLVWSVLGFSVSNHWRWIVTSHHKAEIYWLFGVFWLIYLWNIPCIVGIWQKTSVITTLLQYMYILGIWHRVSHFAVNWGFDRCRADHTPFGNLTGTGVMPMRQIWYISGNW